MTLHCGLHLHFPVVCDDVFMCLFGICTSFSAKYLFVSFCLLSMYSPTVSPLPYVAYNNFSKSVIERIVRRPPSYLLPCYLVKYKSKY